MPRPRKPTAILEASEAFAHDPQRRAARENEPVPSGPLGDPPDRFTKMQREAWFELMLQAPENVLTIADRVMVEMYCVFVARMRGGDPDPYSDDEDGQDDDLPIKVLAPQILKAAEYNLLLNLLGRMGLTPSDRSRLNVPSKKTKDSEDTFGRLATTPRGGKKETKQ